MVALSGCGDAEDPAGEGGGGGDSTGGGEDGLTHGFVALRFSGDASLFAGTQTVVATLSYGPCLSSFYDANPQMRQYGNFGQLVFGDGSTGGEGWKSRLCGDAIDHTACSIVWITQRFDSVHQLAVTYELGGDLTEGTLLFGPLPTAETAQCDDDMPPTVIASTGETIRGTDADGHDRWHTMSVVPSQAATNQVEPMVVQAVAIGQ